MKTPFRYFYPATLAAFAVTILAQPAFPTPAAFKNKIHREDLRETLRAVGVRNEFPTEIEVTVDQDRTSAILQYGLDPTLQERMEQLLTQYRPDYGAFVALEPDTGRILAMVSSAQGRKLAENFATRATFPSASIFNQILVFSVAVPLLMVRAKRLCTLKVSRVNCISISDPPNISLSKE
jgi:membrane peptidoglycan carboxypeptidase